MPLAVAVGLHLAAVAGPVGPAARRPLGCASTAMITTSRSAFLAGGTQAPGARSAGRPSTGGYGASSHRREWSAAGPHARHEESNAWPDGRAGGGGAGRKDGDHLGDCETL